MAAKEKTAPKERGIIDKLAIRLLNFGSLLCLSLLVTTHEGHVFEARHLPDSITGAGACPLGVLSRSSEQSTRNCGCTIRSRQCTHSCRSNRVP